MNYKKIVKLVLFIELSFVLFVFLFLAPNFQKINQQIFERYSFFITGFPVIVIGVYGALHPTEVIAWERSNQPTFLNRFFPKPGDERAVSWCWLILAILGIAIVATGLL
jgi:hypothetical protein